MTKPNGRPKLTEASLKEEDVYPAPSLRAATVLKNEGFPTALKDVATEYDRVIPVNRSWRHRITDAQALALADLEDVFYACGAYGASFDDVCRYFGVSPVASRDIEGLKEIHQKGIAELRMKLRRVQIEEALTKKNPLMLIWVSKNFGGMGDDGTTSLSVDEAGNGSLGIFPGVVQVQANRDVNGRTLGPSITTVLEFKDDEKDSPTASE